MLYSSVMVDRDSVEGRFIERFFGRCNDMPPNSRQVDLGKLVELDLTNATPMYTEYRQIIPAGQMFPDSTMILYYANMVRGFATITSWHARTIRHFVFDCVDLLKKAYDELPIEKDGKWIKDTNTSITIRGITDYNKFIVVSRELNADEELVLREYVKLNNPGNTGVQIVKGDLVYCLRTCYDCSD